MSSLLILPLILAMMAPASVQDGASQDRQRIRLPAGDPVEQATTAAGRDELVLKTYEVRLVVNRMTPDEPSWTSGKEDERSEDLRAATAERRKMAVKGLMQSLKAHLSPAWDDERNAMNDSGTGVLVVLATKRQHLWIKEFLSYVRERGVEMLVLKMQLVEVPLGGLTKLGFEPPMATIERRADLDSLLERVSQDRSSSIVSRPSIGLRSMVTGKVEVIQEVAYVKEWKVTLVAPEKQLIADPVIDVIREGITLQVLPTALPRDRYGISLEFQRTSIARPIPTRKVRIATDPEREVSVSSPEVTRVSLSSSFVLDKGSSVVFTTPANDDQHDLLVIVTAEEMDVTEFQDPDDKPGSDRRR